MVVQDESLAKDTESVSSLKVKKDQYYPGAGPQCSHEMTESSSFMNTGVGLWGLV